MDMDRIDQIIDGHGAEASSLIQVLLQVQSEYHWLPGQALERIGERLQVPTSRIFHIATFYKAFSLEPRGETVIQICVGTTCHVKGAARLLETFERELDVREGRTTPDGKYSLEAVACLGCCSLAPVVKLGDEVLGGVQSKQIARMIKKHRSK
jgi:NADH-quinone oxidoreductase subunit E